MVWMFLQVHEIIKLSGRAGVWLNKAYESAAASTAAGATGVELRFFSERGEAAETQLTADLGRRQ